ncbi:coniferyl aldehyde dehydrogenase [Rhodomicrobium sp. Az07]|uniref:coniferyl aldehyde dehydrogenase n=1 Tax=Rhodomicrobium sp. Az07 TaxID=2839034 RepID=UPI001BE8AB8E|nr:coniferyl aldehyde dehydrogenase [Rhodomicrobium sp. Az07]MBT3071785.1 coniferyl aldehyde dehydrogenase [Rhodomicrobium sp. Az07]
MTTLEAPDVKPQTRLAEVLDLQRAAFLRDGAPSLNERRDDLKRLIAAIKENVDAIATAISADFGSRSKQESIVADTWPVVAGARNAAKHLPGWMKPKSVGVGIELLPGRGRILYQPLGVVGIVSPWNYPFQLAIAPLVAALAAGNRVMLKPSELTPRTSEFLAGFLAKLFPEEKVATVLGGPEVGAAFSALPFDHLFYTGSTEIGRRVMRAAAENLTPVTLELGGKSPCIINADADLAAACRSIAFGKLLNAGQTCIAPDYALVPKPMLGDFVAGLEAAIRALYPTLRDNPDYTSIVNARHYARIARLVDEARERGVRVVEINPAAEKLAPEARKFAPTLVVDPPADLAVMREEIFGPVLPILSYDAFDDAIAFVNARPRPLALYYFGVGTAGRDRVLARTTSGGAAVNETLLHVAAENLPFGGVGASGMGAYHGEAGFRTFSHAKSVFLQSRLNATNLLHPPYGRAADFMRKFLVGR